MGELTHREAMGLIAIRRAEHSRAEAKAKAEAKAATRGRVG